MDAAQREWHQWSEQSGQRLEKALTGGIQSGLERHAAAITTAEDALARTNHRHWERIQGALEQTATAAAGQQAELVKQGQIFREIVAATGEVKRLEVALNENLAALAGEKHFEDTVMSLAAAIQLLSVRLGRCVGPRKASPTSDRDYRDEQCRMRRTGQLTTRAPFRSSPSSRYSSARWER